MKAMQSILVLAMVIFTPLCQANDFPTADRVEFVLECMRDHKGVEFEPFARAFFHVLRQHGHAALVTGQPPVSFVGEFQFREALSDRMAGLGEGEFCFAVNQFHAPPSTTRKRAP